MVSIRACSSRTPTTSRSCGSSGAPSFAPEAARYGGGDDLSVGPVMAFIDPCRAAACLGEHRDRGRPGRADGAAGQGARRRCSATDPHPGATPSAECDVGEALARRIGMPSRSSSALGDVFERWTGRANPAARGRRERAAGSGRRRGRRAWRSPSAATGWPRALATGAQARRAGSFDPDLVSDVLRATHAELLDGLGDASVWEVFLDGRTGAAPQRDASGRRSVRRGVRPRGRSQVGVDRHPFPQRGRARGGRGRGRRAGRSDVEQLRIAGWLHDLGRVAVPNLIWDKPGPLERGGVGAGPPARLPHRTAAGPQPGACAGRRPRRRRARARRRLGLHEVAPLGPARRAGRDCSQPATSTARSERTGPIDRRYTPDKAAATADDEAGAGRLDLAAGPPRPRRGRRRAAWLAPGRGPPG